MQSRLQHLEAYQAISRLGAKSQGGARDKPSRYYVANGPRSVCWACLNDHESSSCLLKRCYRCAKPGHEAGQCPSDEYCDFCGNTGHSKSSQCYKQVYNLGLDPRNHEEIQCMTCGEMGHMNCFHSKPKHGTSASSRKRGRDD